MYNNDIDEYRYSLCIVYTGNNGQNLSYRIADYYPGKGVFEEASYTDKYEYYNVFLPTIIGANPEELELGSACIRKWKPKEEDDKKQWSYSYDSTSIYEILINRDILEAPDQETVINILASGIDIPWYIDNNFLLPISKNGSDYDMILCSKRDFVLKGGQHAINTSVSDMLHTTHCYNKYTINKNDWIDNNLLKRILNSTDGITETRYFYAYDNLPTACGFFIPRTADMYISAFLKWYCRKERSRLNITKRESDKLIELMNFASDNDKELFDYLKNAPFSKDEIVDALNQRMVQVGDFLREIPDVDAVIKQVLNDNPDLFEKCITVVTDRWMESESALRKEELDRTQKAVSRRIELEEKADDLEKELQNLRNEVVSQQEELNAFKKEAEEAKVCKEKITTEIKTQLEGFEDDVVQIIKTMGIVDYWDGSKQGGSQNSSPIQSFRIYQTECRIQTYETDPDTVEELYEDLADNLSIWFENPSDIAAFVIACFTNKLGIIVPEAIGSHVAVAYSMMVDGTTPLNVEITQNSDSIFAVADAINGYNKRTIYIQGLIDGFKEPLVGALMRLCPEKDIFFSFGDVKALALMSNALFDKTLFLDAEQMLKIIPDYENGLNKSHQENGVVFDFDTEEVKNIYNRYLKKLYDEHIIRRLHSIQLSYVINAYYVIYPDKMLGGCMRSAVVQMCDLDDASEQIDEVLKLQRE